MGAQECSEGMRASTSPTNTTDRRTSSARYPRFVDLQFTIHRCEGKEHTRPRSSQPGHPPFHPSIHWIAAFLPRFFPLQSNMNKSEPYFCSFVPTKVDFLDIVSSQQTGANCNKVRFLSCPWLDPFGLFGLFFAICYLWMRAKKCWVSQQTAGTGFYSTAMLNSVESRLSLPIYLNIAICTMMRGKPRNKETRRNKSYSTRSCLEKKKLVDRSVKKYSFISSSWLRYLPMYRWKWLAKVMGKINNRRS